MSADTPTTGIPPTRGPAAGTYLIDTRRSTVAFSGRHMFGLAGVKAAFTLSSGTVHLADPVTESAAVLTVDARSFSSDKTKRDTHVRSAALLDADNHPEITFASDGVRVEGAGWVVTGSVTALGTSVPVEVHVTDAVQEGDNLRVHARTEHLDRYAFGVSKVKGMAGRYLDLDFDIVALPA